MTLRFKRIDDEAGLLALEGEWRALFVAAGAPSPFVDFDWVATSWRQAVRGGKKPIIATVREGGELVLAIALERRRFRQIFHRYHSLEGLMPQHDDGLMRPGTASEVARWLKAVRHGLRRSLLDSVIVLRHVPDYSPFRQAAATQGSMRFERGLQKVDLRGGYADYFAAFSRKTRSQIRRMERLLDPDGSVPLRLATLQSFDADLDWLLLQKRAWTPPDGQPLRDWLSDAVAEADFRALGRRWLARGQFVLATIETEGRPAAACLCLASGKQLLMYVTTYDPALSEASPGRILALRLIEWAAAQGYEQLDFMGGRRAWKERLKTGDYKQYRLKLRLSGLGF